MPVTTVDSAPRGIIGPERTTARVVFIINNNN